MNQINLVGILLALLFLLSVSFALTPNDTLWNGNIGVYLDKPSFTQDETITGSVVINNNETFPIIGAKIIFQIAQGTYSYPSQLNNDNVIYESNLSELYVLPNSSKAFPFTLPKQYSGEYRLDVYSEVQKTILSGFDSIFLSPFSTNFSVSGNNSLARANIVRSTTVFSSANGKGIGPIGFPAMPNSKITGTVFIKNNSATSKDNMKLKVSLCEWTSVRCTNLTEQEISVPSIGAGETKSVEVKLNVPSSSSVYEINMVLSSASGIESIYKNRVIVEGPTAKVRKMFFEGIASGQYSLTAIIAGSPDHFSYPTFSNFKLIAQVFDKDSVIEEKSVDIPLADSNTILAEKFELSSKSFTKICILAQKEGTIYEQECMNIPLEALLQDYFAKHPKLIAVSWNYDEAAKQLTINLNKEKINSEINLYAQDETIFSERINTSASYTKTISVEKQNLILTVDDIDIKRQQVFNINLAVPKGQDASAGVSDTQAKPVETITCTGTICAGTQTCASESYVSKDGLCCRGNCTSAIVPSALENILSIPLIVWVALILVVLAIISAFNAVKVIKK